MNSVLTLPHTELAAPYDVLLGRLGDDRLRQLGRNWQAEPRESGPQPGCIWFEQTGHNVCNQGGALGFRRYWESNGLRDPRLNRYGQSLALFGLPLTAPRMETNTSGDNVLTQWFKRARFEWHPNQPNQFKVLLGLLGNEVRTGVGLPTPTTGPTTPTATATTGPTTPTATATTGPTATRTTGPTATATTGPTATPTLPPPSLNNCLAEPQAPNAPNYPVRIVGINKVTEVVTLRNVSGTEVSLNGWTMCSIRGNQTHPGISGTLAPGQQRDFAYVGGNIWSNDQEDDGALYNQEGRLVSYWND